MPGVFVGLGLDRCHCGDRVERVTCAAVRNDLTGCTPDCTCYHCGRKRKKAKPARDLFTRSDDGGDAGADTP